MSTLPSRLLKGLQIKLEQFGHKFLAHFHSHPGRGAEATNPSGVDQGFKRLALFQTQPDNVLFDRGLWHDSIPDDVMMTLPESHRLLSESTTWGTSCLRKSCRM